MKNLPERRCIKNSKTLSLRVEPELETEFRDLKETSRFDVPEAQRQALRELAKRLRTETKK